MTEHPVESILYCLTAVKRDALQNRSVLVRYEKPDLAYDALLLLGEQEPSEITIAKITSKTTYSNKKLVYRNPIPTSPDGYYQQDISEITELLSPEELRVLASH
jgi:hypothetical protein